MSKDALIDQLKNVALGEPRLNTRISLIGQDQRFSEDMAIAMAKDNIPQILKLIGFNGDFFWNAINSISLKSLASSIPALAQNLEAIQRGEYSAKVRQLLGEIAERNTSINVERFSQFGILIKYVNAESVINLCDLQNPKKIFNPEFVILKKSVERLVTVGMDDEHIGYAISAFAKKLNAHERRVFWEDLGKAENLQAANAIAEQGKPAPVVEKGGGEKIKDKNGKDPWAAA